MSGPRAGAPAAVIAVRRAQRDAAARALADRTSAVASAREQLDHAEQNLARADERLAAHVAAATRVDARAQLDRYGLEDAVHRARAAVVDAARALESRIEMQHAAQQQLADAERELKVIEKLDERVRERAQVEARQRARRG